MAIDEAAWIGARLADLGARRIGELEPVQARPWSTVLRVPTDRGDLFFTASAAAWRHEVAVVTLLARRRPDVVPAPLASDPGRGWMLMADAGVRLRELIAVERDVSRWLDVLPLYGGLQADLASDAAELVALGAPDLRLVVLPARYEALLDELGRLDDGSGAGELLRRRAEVPRVAAMCNELARYGIPETIQHDDLSDAAVYVLDGRYRILDWGDACVAHPFFSLSVALEGVIAWGVDDVAGSVDIGPFRDAYLGSFGGLGSGEELRAACALGLRLGWVCRAVNGHVPGADAGPTWTRLRMAFDGHP